MNGRKSSESIIVRQVIFSAGCLEGKADVVIKVLSNGIALLSGGGNQSCIIQKISIPDLSSLDNLKTDFLRDNKLSNISQ